MAASLKLVRSAPLASPRTTVGFLQRLENFSGLDLRALEQLASRVEVRRVRRGEPVWVTGARPDEVVWVRSGVVRVTRTVGEREVTIGYHGRGDLLGLDGGSDRPTDAVAHEDTALLVVSRTDLDAWVVANPSSGPALVAVMSTATCRLQERLALVTMNGAKARLVALLLDLAARFGVRDSRGVIIDLRLTHREMASLIGATRETVSVAIVELRSEKVVRTESRRVILTDEEALRGLAE